MKAWEGTIEIPVPDRSRKPRRSGFTMLIDKGLGLNATRDLVDLAADYVDDVKLTFGTSAFYDEEVIRQKIRLLREAEIEVMPGGTFLEVAIWQGALDGYLKRAGELGFSFVEISDGTIPFDDDTRLRTIEQARRAGFGVITEVGRKDFSETPEFEVLAGQIQRDLEAGAFKVIIEAREAGTGTLLYDERGKVREGAIERFSQAVADPNAILWEAPLKAQQQHLILAFGPNVNLGNVAPEDILALEALRVGLRGDTLKKAWRESQKAEA